MKKINFENFKSPGLSKEVLMQLQDNIEEAIEDKNIITRNIDRQNITVSSGWGTTDIPLSSENSIGNKLTSVLNGIKIGANVSKVLVSAYFEGIGHNGADGDKSIGIEQNGTSIAGAYQSGDVTAGYMSSSIIPTLVNVSEGDVFSLSISSGGSGTFEILGGRLTVEVVL